MAAEGGRVGLKKGGKPWGTGPQPGTLEFFQQETQTPKRKRKKAAGGRIGRAPGGSAMKHGVKKLFERFGGGEKGKPHSSKEGRIAAGKRNIERMIARRKRVEDT